MYIANCMDTSVFLNQSFLYISQCQQSFSAFDNLWLCNGSSPQESSAHVWVMSLLVMPLIGALPPGNHDWTSGGRRHWSHTLPVEKTRRWRRRTLWVRIVDHLLLFIAHWWGENTTSFSSYQYTCHAFCLAPSWDTVVSTHNSGTSMKYGPTHLAGNGDFRTLYILYSYFYCALL